MANNKNTGFEIAIIGMSCRFPGAKDWRAYWDNLKNEVESIRFFTDDELIELGVNRATMDNKNFVKAGIRLEGKQYFDSSFFDYRPDEAKLMNPEHRLFHECVWNAIEDAGYNIETINDSISIYAGAEEDLNWQVYSNIINMKGYIDNFSLGHINNKDYLASLLSYKLNLNGSAVSVNTACSTSLVAIHLACRSLLLRETKIAIAGASAIDTQKRPGYFYKEGDIYSKDGHCKSFDKDASGTLIGEGVAAIVLKRLNDATNDGDHIYAIIKGSAINNDGSQKVGFTTPSVEGQAKCIKMAHSFSKVDPGSISYIETHGTATELGDPIEIEALNLAFNNNKNKSCAIGSVKTNIGHLFTAAGIAGLIKTALSLKYKQLPASLHFKSPNPNIDFDDGPFYVNTKLTDWKNSEETPLRAGVSSFGIGGTNAHAILEEAPNRDVSGKSSRKYKLLVVSAKTATSLKNSIKHLKEYLLFEEDLNLADMSYTFKMGRKYFRYRKALAYEDKSELIALLNENTVRQKPNFKDESPPVCFMFSGAGSQYVNMGRDLYENESFFKEEMDNGFRLLKKLTGEDYKNIIYPEDSSDHRINDMIHAQPLIFLFGYSLVRLLASWGIKPQVSIGHSIGEYIAACINNVFDYEDALKLVVIRGKLMNQMPPGGMLSVSISEKEALKFVTDNISLAAINGPEQVVFSGDIVSIEQLIITLDALDISFVKLYATHAGHSYMIDQISEEYKKELSVIKMNEPTGSFISNLTGDFISVNEAQSADYWTKHMRQKVNFSKGINKLISVNEETLFIEIGGGHSLTSLLRQHGNTNSPLKVLNIIRHPKDADNDHKYLIERLGQIWEFGVVPDWNAFYKDEKRQKIPLPTYSFDQFNYPVEVNAYETFSNNILNDYGVKKTNPDDWFYKIQWKQAMRVPGKAQINDSKVLVFLSDSDLHHKIFSSEISGKDFVFVTGGEKFKKVSEDFFIINPKREKDYKLLFSELFKLNILPTSIYHLWNFEFISTEVISKLENIDHYLTIGYESILMIVRNFNLAFENKPLRLSFISNGLYSVLGTEAIHAIKSAALGALKVVRLEYPNILCRIIDLTDDSKEGIDALLNELNYDTEDIEIAIRGKNKYVKHFEKIDFNFLDDGKLIKRNGVYLITGANGGMAKIFSEFLVTKYHVNLILTGRNEIQKGWISKLEAKGCKIIYINSDISDFAKIQKEIDLAETKLGIINGVIHTAGLADFGGIISERRLENDKKIFIPKIYGTSMLNEIFKNKKLDFFVNCSSQTASLAQFGQVAYISSNLYQSAIAESKKYAFPQISIEWPILQDTGMAVNSSKQSDYLERGGQLRYGINSNELIEIFLRALYLKIPVQIISTVSFPQYYKNYYWDFKKQIEEIENMSNQLSSERPNLSTEYLMPNTITEKKITNMLETFFGIENIGVNDSFFELGGDSLKAMVIMKRINKEFGINISFKKFLEKSRIGDICFEIDTMLWLKKEVKTENEVTI